MKRKYLLIFGSAALITTAAGVYFSPQWLAQSELVAAAPVEPVASPVLLPSNEFLGSWCNNDKWAKEGEYFELEFRMNPDGNMGAEFNSGGPFSEVLKTSLSVTGVDLYFGFVEGSMSFNEAAEKYDASECLEKVAVVNLIDSQTMEVSDFNDVCGYLSGDKGKRILTKLDAQQSCLP